MADPLGEELYDATEFARTHRPSYVIEAPGTMHEWTRVKCNGSRCDFYVERRGRRNWYEALDAHSEHVAELLLAREAAAVAEALRQAGVKVAAMRNGVTGRRVTNATYLGEVVHAMGLDVEFQAERAARRRKAPDS